MSPEAELTVQLPGQAAQAGSCLPEGSHVFVDVRSHADPSTCPLHACAGLGQPSWAALQWQEPWWGQTGWSAVMSMAWQWATCSSSTAWTHLMQA